MDFKPIETKDELDKLIEKEVAKARKDFEGYISPDELKKQTDALSAQITDLTEKNKSLELGALRTKAARKYGIKPELEDRLRGEDEKSIEEDAKALSGFFAQQQEPAPLKSTEDALMSAEDSAYRSLLDGLTDI